MDLYMSEI